MSEQGIRAFRPFGRHFWLVVAAVLALAAGTSVALAVSGGSVVSIAQANHCPGLDFQSGETQEIDGVNVTVTFSGKSGTVTADAPISGTISIFGGGDTQEIPFNITEPGGSVNFTFNSQHDISHVCIFAEAAPPPTTDTTDTTTTETETVPRTETETVPTTQTETVPGPPAPGPGGAVAGAEVAQAAPGAAAAPAGEAAPSELAFTGMSALALGLTAGGMLALGLGLRRASRRTD